MPPAPHDDLAAAAAQADALEHGAAIARQEAAGRIGAAADSPLDPVAEGHAYHAARNAAVHAERYAQAAESLARLAGSRAEDLHVEAAALDSRDPFAPPGAPGFRRPGAPEASESLDRYYSAAERADRASQEASRHFARARAARELAGTAGRSARQHPACRAAEVHRARADEAQTAADTLAAEAGQRQLDLSRAQSRGDPGTAAILADALDQARTVLAAADDRADSLARIAADADSSARLAQPGDWTAADPLAWWDQRERAYSARADVQKGTYPAIDRRGQSGAQAEHRLLDLSARLAETWDAGTAADFTQAARELSRILNIPETRYPSAREDPREIDAFSRRFRGQRDPRAARAAARARNSRDEAARALPPYAVPGTEACFETTPAALAQAARHVRQLCGLRLDADPGADLRTLRIAAARDLWTAALRNSCTPGYPGTAVAAARAELLAAVAAGHGSPAAPGAITIYDRLNSDPLPRPVLDAEQFAEQEAAENDRARTTALRDTALRADDTAHLTPPGTPARDGLLRHAAGLYETAAGAARQHHARATDRAAAARERYRRAEPAAADGALAWARELSSQAALAARAAEQLAQAAASTRAQARPEPRPRALGALSRARRKARHAGTVPGRRSR